MSMSKEECEEYFKSIDRNADGKVNQEELIDAVKCLCKANFEVAPSDKQIKGMLKGFDRDGDGLVSLDELVEDMCIKAPRLPFMKNLFREHDKDGSGCLSREEVYAMVVESGLHKGEVDKFVDTTFEQSDADLSNGISEEEFLNSLMTFCSQVQAAQ